MTIYDKRIAIFLPTLEGGGAERVMINLAKGFIDLGNQVDFVLVKKKGVYIEKVAPTVNIIDFDCRSTLRSLPKLVKYLGDREPHLLISTLNTPNVTALVAKFFHKGQTRFVIREANTLSLHLNNKGIKRCALTWLTKKIYPHADAIVAVSKGVAEDLKSFCCLDERKIKIIQNPVVVPDDVHGGHDDHIHEWLLYKNKPTIIAVGRLEKQKNFELLIRAFKRVRDKIDIRLIILGEGSMRAALETLIESLDIRQHISMPGFQINPYSYMARADLFVLSSLWEGFPNSLVEALACGCPVVSTDCQSGPAEILDDGKYGALVPLNDIESMATEIVSALSSPRDKKSLIQRANEFSLEKTARLYLES